MIQIKSENAMAEGNVALVRCNVCDSPVVLEAGHCNGCSCPLDGSEAKYINYIPADDTISSLKRLVFAYIVVMVFSGFSPGVIAYSLLGIVSVHYAIQIIKAL
mgnify:CR=1 FL=1